MGIEDLMEAEVGVAVAATAALLSPRARTVMRRGAVYGLAGALKAGDAVASAARGVANGVRHDDEPQPAPPGRAPARNRQPRAPAARAGNKAAEAQP